MQSLPTLLFLAAGLTSCGLLGMSAEDRDELARYQRNAALYYDSASFDQSLDQIRRGLELSPDDYKLQTLKGWCLLRQLPRDPTLLAAANAQFETVMAYRSLDDHGPQALLGYGLCQQKLAQERIAQASALRAELEQATFDKSEVNIRQASALAHESVAQGQLEIAERHFQVLIDRGDVLLEAHQHMMQTKALGGKYAEAAAHGEQFLVRCQERRRYWEGQRDATEVVPYERRARVELDRLVDLELQVRGFLANMSYKRGQWAQAVEQLDAILIEDPTRSTDYYNRALNLVELGRETDAARDFRQFLATSRLPQGNERISLAQRHLRRLDGR